MGARHWVLTIFFGGLFLTRIGAAFDGSSVLVKNSKGILSAVELEKYVAQVVSAEMPESWPVEALKAQAVLARTYALYQFKTGRKYLEMDSRDQNYSQTQAAATVRTATEATAGLVLTNHHRLLQAVYHADCGGETDSDPWLSGQKDLQRAIDSACRLRTKNQWRFSLSEPELIQNLLKLAQYRNLKVVSAVTIRNTDADGRVKGLELRGIFDSEKQPRTFIITGEQLRSILGYNRLKSSRFTVSLNKKNTFEFEGKGWGHGGGLCQQGAKSLAESGSSFKEILQHYFAGSELQQVPTNKSETPVRMTKKDSESDLVF